MERYEQQLNRLFAAYRAAFADPEVSANFMPDIWAKIESRRGFGAALRRWTGAFVTAAAALCLAMIVYMSVPDAAEAYRFSGTYVEALEQPEAFETLAFSEMVEFEVIDTSLSR